MLTDVTTLSCSELAFGQDKHREGTLTRSAPLAGGGVWVFVWVGFVLPLWQTTVSYETQQQCCNRQTGATFL